MSENQSIPFDKHKADKDKRFVALTSVIAAIFLTGMKVVVGLSTGSLGILSEAAHSGLDLVAAAVTFFAVRAAGKPADKNHTYGHGKVENLSALFETVLLLATCGWIIYEAVHRLFYEPVVIKVNAWGFGVLIVSIVIDFSRSRALKKAAVKYKSQALEADALHFSTDIWSSLVVLLGLGLVWLAQYLHIAWLAQADAVAAVGVAGIVIWISISLGKRSINDLIDTVPDGLAEQITQAVRVPGVKEVRHVRVRSSGPETFADVILTVDSALDLEKAHQVATAAENAAAQALPGTDVVVHVEPTAADPADVLHLVQQLASRFEARAHGLRIFEDEGQRHIEVHLELNGDLQVVQAYQQAQLFKAELRHAIRDIGEIVTHLEPISEIVHKPEVRQEEEKRILQLINELKTEGVCVQNPHKIKSRRIDGQLAVSFHCQYPGQEKIAEAHAFTVRVEQALRAKAPDVGVVIIQLEPGKIDLTP